MEMYEFKGRCMIKTRKFLTTWEQKKNNSSRKANSNYNMTITYTTLNSGLGT